MYLTIFGICFLAATVLPLGSEPAVAGMAAADVDIAGLLVVATLGNYLGALCNYAIGRWGRTWGMRRYFATQPKLLDRAERFYARWGAPSLFFAWLPVVGDPLTILAGMLRAHPLLFTVYVLPGKALRYYLIILGVEKIGSG